MKALKGTKLYSIFTGTCPVCHQGKIYKESNPWKLRQLVKMHEYCSHCGFKFMIEPAFFYGAMYVSYAVGTAIAVAAFIIAFFFLGLDIDYTFVFIFATLVVAFPYLLRISRNIWLNIFVKYDKTKADSPKKDGD